MIEFKLNKYKILYNKDFPNKIGYDVRIYKEYGSLATACIFNKAKILCRNGEFGISDNDFSKQLNIPLRTFKRAKQMLKTRLNMRIDKGNKTYYSLINDISYDPIYYRSFELNYCLIMNNNHKGGAFLSQCLYWWNKTLAKGQLEFSKTDKQIMEDLPFLSHDILTSIKKIAILKGFITIRRKKRGSEWGVSHYTINPNRIEKAIEENCEPKGQFHKLLEDQVIVWAKIPIECGPKSRLSVGQNPAFTINKPIYNSILSSTIDQNESEKTVCDTISEERKKIKNQEEKQPMHISNQSPKIDKEEIMEKTIKPYEDKNEIYTMIGIWKEIISNTEPITISQALKISLEEAFTQKFDRSLDKWRAYCLKISTNDWLMGNNNVGFKAKLIWGLKLESINKVLSGSIYGKKKRSNYKTDQKPIIIDKKELIDEIFSGHDPLEIKKIKVLLIDSMDKFKQIGLRSYHTYFRSAIFEVSDSDGKKLSIKSSYSAFNSTLPYHELMVRIFQQFDEVIIYEGPKDKGQSLYMERKPKEIETSSLWERLCIEKDVQSFVSLHKIDMDKEKNFPEKTKNLMGVL